MADKKSHIVLGFFVVQSYFAQTLHHNERYHGYSLKMKGHKNYENLEKAKIIYFVHTP